MAALLALAAGSGACTSTSTTTTTTDDSDGTTVALLIRPASFLGTTPCSAAAGAMRSYVATLVDVTDPAVPFTLPSSLPAPCSQGVRFDDVAPGRSYVLHIDGYEAFATEIGPTGWINANGQADYTALRSGSRHMTAANGTPVAPRWLGSCGEGDNAPAVPPETGLGTITECDPVTDAAPGSTDTFIEVAPQDALGALRCASDPDKGPLSVASFDLIPQGGLPGLLGIPCLDAPFVQTYSGGALSPGATVDFFVGAHAAAGGPVVWGATCSALVEEGLTVRAACSSLSASGALRIDVTSLLDLVDAECSGEIQSYDAELTAGDVTLVQEALPCTGDATFSSLEPGSYTARATLLTKDLAELFQFTCTATVEPGRTATAECLLQP